MGLHLGHAHRRSPLHARNARSLRVTVKNLDGTIVADGITVDELSRTDPMLGTLYLDAR